MNVNNITSLSAPCYPVNLWIEQIKAWLQELRDLTVAASSDNLAAVRALANTAPNIKWPGLGEIIEKVQNASPADMHEIHQLAEEMLKSPDFSTFASSRISDSF